MESVELKIFYIDDNVTKLRCKVNKWKFQDTLMGEQFITFNITSAIPIDFAVGDFCQFRGETYTLNYIPSVTQKSRSRERQDAYTYENIKFDSYQDELTRCIMLDITPTTGEYIAALGTNYTGSSRFQLFCGEITANGKTLTAVCALAAKMQANLDRIYGNKEWLISVDTDSTYKDSSGYDILVTHTDDKVMSFDNTTVAQALAEVHNTFNLDYCVKGRNIYIGYEIKDLTSDSDSDTFVFGYGKGYPTRKDMNKGLFQIKRIANSQQKIVTRLRALGSTKNMPYRYYNKKYGGDSNPDLSQTLFPTNLQLPDTFIPEGSKSDSAGTNSKWGHNKQRASYLRAVKGDTNDAYIDKNDDAENCIEGIREDSARWDGSNSDLQEIYPTIEGATYGELRGALVEDQDGNTGQGSFPNYGDNERIDSLLAIGHYIDNVLTDDANKGNGILPESGTMSLGITKAALITETTLNFNSRTNGDFTKIDNILAGKDKTLFTISDVTAGEYLMVPTGPSYDSVIYGFSISREGISVEIGYQITIKQTSKATGKVSSVIYMSDFVSISKNDNIKEVALPEIPDVKNENPKVEKITVTESSDIEVIFTPVMRNVPSSFVGEFSLVYAVGKTRLGSQPYESEYTWRPVGTSDGTDETFHVFVKDMGFDITACWTNDTPVVAMKSGRCTGREFEIGENVEKVTYEGKKGYMLTLKRAIDSTLNTYYPSATDPISPDDYFVLLNISMPDVYVGMAEVRLLKAASDYLADNSITQFTYQPYIDNLYLQRNLDLMTSAGTPEKSIFWRLYAGLKFSFRGIPAREEDPLPLIDITIKQVTIQMGEGITPKVEIILNDDVQQSTLQRLTMAVDRIYNGSLYASGGGSGNGGVSITKLLSLIQTEGAKLFLSKTKDDAANGLITFLKGIKGAGRSWSIDGFGTALLKALTTGNIKSPGYTNPDIIGGQGFSMWEDDEGKSHVITDYFTARVKAFFASLEIRKIEHSAGNRIESPAGNTLALVKKFDAKGNEIVDKWYARRYKFAGVNLALKLVHMTGQFFGVWQEDPSATVAFYRCYWTAEDKEEKKAVVNNWKVGDQAFCQTFNLRNLSGYVSNKRYWRLVENTGYETIEDTKYAYIDLSNTLWLELTVDGVTKTCKGYETNGGQNFNDAPEAGDDVACLGNQITPETRGGAIQHLTYGEVDNTTGIPCVKMYSGIGGNADYPFDLDRYLIQKQSPKGVFVRADKFEILSASGTGNSSTLTCERGAWDSNQTYGHNDIVQHHGSTWRCVIASGTTQVEPSESVPTIWQVYARRGTSAPQAELDSANAVVSANYEGKISNISQVTGLPTTVEVYVEGNKIPTSDWDLTNSYIKWKNKKYGLHGIFAVGFGVEIDSIAINTDNVSVIWVYRPEHHMTIEGEEIVHPVINPTDFIAHVEFTHNGEAQSADISIPMIVQKAAANVVAQYSADNSSWHSALAATDIYVRYSYDGGTTWTTGTRFVGKSIEFDRGIRHFASYDDLMNYLVSIQAYMTDKDMGYYIADTDDGGTPEATLWYFYSQSSDPRDIVNVPFPSTGELNYLTSYDGHLWNADNTSTSWADMGKIQGADGIDGISVTLDPATVIFEQDENNTSTINGLPFVSTIRVWKGTTILQPSDYSVGYDSSKQDGHCDFNVSGNIVTITALNTDSTTQAPYTSGKVVITVTYNGTPIDLAINWAANLLGTWKMTVVGDVMREVSRKTVSYTNDDGTVTTEQWQSAIEQSSQRISLSAKKDDLETAGIHLDGENSRIDLLADKTQFLRSIDRLPFIKIGVDDDNMPYLIFMMPDGVTEAYNLGYKGLVSLIDEGVRAGFSNEVRLVLLGYVDDYLDEGVPCEDLYNGCTDPLSQYFYRYNQTRMKQANGTYVIVPATPNYDGMYYNGNTIDEGNPNRFPVSTLQTLDDISGALEDDITLWVGFRTRLDGWDDTDEPIARMPMINYTATCVLYWVQNSRVIRSEQIAVTRNKMNKSSDNVYFITNSDGSTNDHYIIN